MAAGKEIKRLRNAKGIGAEKAATLIGVGVDKYRKWEERDTDPSDTGDIQKVEAYFGVPLSGLKDIKEFDFVEFSRDTSGKDEVIRILKEQVSDLRDQRNMLKEQVSSLQGQIRHLLLMTHSKLWTNQNALADLLVKLKIESANKVEDRLSKENVSNYQKSKDEIGIG